MINPELEKAIKADDGDKIDQFAQAGEDIRSLDGLYAPIHLAASADAPNAIGALVKNGVSVDQLTEDGGTATHVAAGRDAARAIAKLHALGANIHHSAEVAMTPLHHAARLDMPKAADQLIICGADVNVKCEDTGQVPLHVAAAGNSTKVIPILVKNRANIEEADKGGLTALCSALSALGTQAEAEAAALLLIEAGANITARSGIGNTVMHWAAFGNGVKTVDLLIKRRVDVNSLPPNQHGQTPLDLSIMKGHHNITELLCKHGGKRGRDL